MYNIVFLTTDIAYGGAETQLVNLAIRLKQRGWDIRVISMLPPQAYTKELEERDIPIATLNMKRGIPDPRAVIRLVKIIRCWKPDIVHSHMVHANLLARIARLFYKVPVLISTAHNINEGARWREIAYRLTDPLADLTTNVSIAATKRYIKVGAVPKDKILFMPNGVDTDKFRPDKMIGKKLRSDLGLDINFVWLAVGRFEVAKDYFNMLQAFKMVVAKKNDAVLLLAGQGSLFDKTRKIAGELGLKDKVRFLGVRHDIPDLMNVADAYVMSSAWEGMPMVLLEAGACGLPIVATDVGGNSEVVLNDRTGYIVPSHDSQALADSMLKMMTISYEKRNMMGQAGRDNIEVNYSLDRVVENWEDIYMKLLSKKGLNSNMSI